ncbi:MAG: ADP-ribosylglycohydrolase family protein [Lachnospiraceae bacterium]|nr:ADP-ribosylglycohydrolase family protein [Lachnospiraceae bacterium]
MQNIHTRIELNKMNIKSKIYGGLLGGAIGDALGYPVEFLSETEIFKRYGSSGITSYDLDFESGFALISDDTQMSMFTANGILRGETINRMNDCDYPPFTYVAEAYADWYCTQTRRKPKRQVSWLMDIPDLYSRRAPGTTCMSAIGSGKRGCVEEPLNMSKGCGGIMRVAPLGLFYDTSSEKYDLEWVDRQGAEIAAITHGHPLGYIPAAVLTHIISASLYGSYVCLEDAVNEAMAVVSGIFSGNAYLPQLEQLIEKAIMLSKNDEEDVANIRQLGEGWVAEETLAIAVYCSLRYENDFSKGVIAAVNHNGDSDSTGAVAGNILGAWLGYDAIEEKWKRNLEFRRMILELADDLYEGRNLDQGKLCGTEEKRLLTSWESKYFDAKLSRPGKEE